jgi:hypothetical protein
LAPSRSLPLCFGFGIHGAWQLVLQSTALSLRLSRASVGSRSHSMCSGRISQSRSADSPPTPATVLRSGNRLRVPLRAVMLELRPSRCEPAFSQSRCTQSSGLAGFERVAVPARFTPSVFLESPSTESPRPNKATVLRSGNPRSACPYAWPSVFTVSACFLASLCTQSSSALGFRRFLFPLGTFLDGDGSILVTEQARSVPLKSDWVHSVFVVHFKSTRSPIFV